jgi:ABC-type multidrug transport system ATPase subunit
MLLDMVHQQGKTIFFSSHNLDEVQRIGISDQVTHWGSEKGMIV